MKYLHRINNQRFSIRLCSVAEVYGFKTVGQMIKTLEKANPNAKWSYYCTHTRTTKLINELKYYVEN